MLRLMRLSLCRAAVAATLVPLLVLAGCGGDDPDSGGTSAGSDSAGDDTGGSGGGSGRDDCPDETAVSDAAGVSVSLDPPTEGGCHYYDETGDVSVGIEVEDPTSRTIEDIERNNADAERVEGLGDAAHESITPGGIVQVGVFEGGRYVLVTVQGADGADTATGRAVYELFASRA